jgi:hypothetical protein
VQLQRTHAHCWLHDMKEMECRVMRKKFHGFEIKIVFIVFERSIYAV